jgi:hypothetical protein
VGSGCALDRDLVSKRADPLGEALGDAKDDLALG